MWIIKRIYAIILLIISKCFSIDFAKKIDTLFRFGKKINLKKPESLSEKVTFIELHDQSLLAAKCTDKYQVRQYITDKGYKDILIPLASLDTWKNVNEIDFSKLPGKFVFKATHGCKMNYIVTDKNKINIAECKKTLHNWLKITYGTYSLEPHYQTIPHRIYAEEYIDDVDELIDYKVHCLNGNPQFILCCSNRYIDKKGKMYVTLDLFDLEWNPIFELKSFKNEIPGKGRLMKPKNLKKMIEVAKNLSREFKFVRVDLYERNGKLLFGELTFSPACCVFPYFSRKFDIEMGAKLLI